MRLKLYRADTMTAAMAQVREELGAEALILSTRRVAGGVEITAALEPDARPPRQPVAVRPQSSASEPAAATPPEQATHVNSFELEVVPARSSGPPLPRATPPQSDLRGRDLRREAAFAFHGVPVAVSRRLAAGPLPFAMAAAFRFVPVPLDAGAAPLLIAGPPGAGKTLTVARLASRLVMRGAAPLVITVDGQRAGATEQLAAFTRLLGVDLIVAGTPKLLKRALTRRVAEAPVLIDAPGVDAHDDGQQRVLQELATSAAATIALVLPAGLDPAEAEEIAAAYRQNMTTLLIANRLDGARRLGGVLSAASIGLSLTEAGIGAGVADGLVPLTPEFLAARLMQFPDAHA